MTFPVNLSDHISNDNFPKNPKMITLESMVKNLIFPPNELPEAQKVRDEDYTHYDEGVFVGYRDFDTKNIDVSYPFGYGLSYTDFEYQSMEVSLKNDTINIAVTIKNTVKFSGKEVVQFYTEKLNSEINRPTQELKAFTKTKRVESEAMERVFVKIPIKELSNWNEKKNDWALEKGGYYIKVGASSRDIRQVELLNL